MHEDEKQPSIFSIHGILLPIIHFSPISTDQLLRPFSRLFGPLAAKLDLTLVSREVSHLLGTASPRALGFSQDFRFGLTHFSSFCRSFGAISPRGLDLNASGGSFFGRLLAFFLIYIPIFDRKSFGFFMQTIQSTIAT